ncbi:MAG TPA: metal-dependent hydrolase [Gemmatimonadaceae bacterium]|nr:metal-dependent hydrolase [Gemmatimonadaceae bacterium]
MDNVTHSLAGLLLAEATVCLRSRRTGAAASGTATVATASLLAANLPDADLLYTGAGGNRLAYMLHHRGYTHTVIGVVIGAILIWGLTLLVLRWRSRQWVARHEAGWLLALLAVSTVSHLVLDWTNSYGVHPFWPFDDRWYYGDSVFIVEPWLWVVSVPALVAASRARAARVMLSLVLLAGVVLAWRVDLVSKGAALSLIAGAVLSIGLVLLLGRSARVVGAMAGWIGVTLVMALGSAKAKAGVLAAARASDRNAEVLDVVVSPLPANAVCMAVITVERSGSVYRVSTVRASAVPSISDAARCATRSEAGSLFHASPRPSTRAVHWDHEWSAPLAELSTLARESCPALAALRFIRVPVWHSVSAGALLLGDARYGGGSGSSFADVRVARQTSVCPRAVPPWTPPRAELFGLATR